MSRKKIDNREKLILTGLYLSKFDRKGLERLGFSSFTEAFNVLGYALNGRPMNIKNYRDEFDPYFENNRKGRRHREVRNYCKDFMDYTKDFDFEYFSELISSYLVKDFKVQKEVDKILKIDREKSFINRISTGLAAENYFIANYQNQDVFKSFYMSDTRNLGCGFDFKLDYESDFYCVEVKGLNAKSGNFLMTQKEFDVAESLNDKYCLYIVKDFCESPFEALYFNPLKKFNLKKIEKEIIQISYQGAV